MKIIRAGLYIWAKWKKIMEHAAVYLLIADNPFH